ncbi:uncharacterized protein N7496_004526 [Penicillium cataractarum]|uniref:AB hydrolase-1 domain-containing protein n=1 Tax=Penicillium cataractarum TaxID=2100454 RepID=A0A9W9SFE4_9EURO|nr:uncharacterized protein N7496_004526 [Penicillium cataractarum]KAJ5377117.1 hypothetical protein N7496_004526 [Penicillium cataractarum]
MVNTKTIRVPHLGGIDAAYQMPREYDPAKPTVVLVNAFTTSSELYRDQFDNVELADKINLVAIELLGHGQTRTAREHWTYWDTAEMNLQVLDALNIDHAFVLGTSQGGWVTVQMALLRPEKILGIIPMGTSMDCESERTRQLDCWDGPAIVSGFVKQWASSEATSNFEPDDGYCDAVINIGFNQVAPEVREFWHKTIKSNYQGEEGRRRIRMAAINLAERGGLHLRLSDIQCPVLWLHGTKDAVYTIANAKEEIQLFTRSPSATLVPVEGGAHFLNASHPREVNAALLEFVNQHK